jgi:hypothetical protein
VYEFKRNWLARYCGRLPLERNERRWRLQHRREQGVGIEVALQRGANHTRQLVASIVGSNKKD